MNVARMSGARDARSRAARAQRDIRVLRLPRLIADLKLASDDATAMAIELEHKFRLKISRQEWGKVSTVQDVIDLFVRHL